MSNYSEILSASHKDKTGLCPRRQIVDFEPLISEIVVPLRLAEGVTISAIFQELDEDQVQMSVDSEQILLFDPEMEHIGQEPDEILWYTDEYLYATLKRDTFSPEKPWVFDHPFFIILNVAIGGPGYPDETTAFPQMMLVDYVRV